MGGLGDILIPVVEVEVVHDGALNCIKMRNAHTHPLPPPGGRPTPPKVFPQRPD